MITRLSVICVAFILAVLSLAGCAGTGPTTPAGTVPALPDSGSRTVAAVYAPGQPLTVSISVVPDNSSEAYAIEDAPPLGWTVSDINESGIFDPITGRVKWGIFFNQCPQYFTYTLTPPPNVQGDQAFAGVLSVDGTDHTLTGQTIISSQPAP